MNEVEMNNEPFEKKIENISNRQTKTTRISHTKDVNIKKKLTQLHEQRNIWWPHDWNSL
jgi:hypothetical protein